MGRKANKEGSVRKLADGSWECIIQSKYLNPETGKPKRFKRKAITEEEAGKKAKMDMRAWEKEFERGRDTKIDKSKTCSIPRQLCVRCCNWLIDKSLLDENYAKQAQIKKEVVDEYIHKQEKRERERKRVFTTEDIEKFYYAYKNNMGEYPVVVLFLLETGLRAGEFSALKTDNIDLDNNKIYIRETASSRFKDNDKDKGYEFYTKVPKSGKERFVVMSDLCKECVLYMMEQTKLKCKNNPDGLLYPSFRSGKMRGISSMEVCFKDLCDKLKIDRDVRLTKTGQQKGLCLHALRHTMTSIANSAKGANVVNTALMTGHTAIKTENIYTHATEEGLKSVITPSKAVLEGYRENVKVERKEVPKEEQELYEMYLKLKEKFE